VSYFKVPLHALIDQSFCKFTILRALDRNLLRRSAVRILAVGLALCCMQSLVSAKSLQQPENMDKCFIESRDGAGVCNSEQLNTCCPGDVLALSSSADSAADEPNKDKDTVVPESTVKPVVRPNSRTGSRFALAFKSSTLGLGAELGTRLADRVNLRVGFTGFNYSRTVSDGGISYLGTLRLRSAQTVVDWFPSSHGFHLSPGLLIYDNNHVTANALLPTGKVLTSGTEAFISNPRDPIRGSATSAMRQVVPMMLFGFGNIIPRSRHLVFAADFGVAFQGQPKTSFALIGSGCDPSGRHCRDIAHDPNVQADVRSGEKTLQDDLSIMKYYPIVSIQFGYRF
jgi:hypothetical protein